MPRFEIDRSVDGHPIRDLKTDTVYGQSYNKQALVDLINDLSGKAERATPIENGKNRYGVDISYFRNLINRELNRGLQDYRPDELARVFARMAMAADPEVLKEPEFNRK
jgi:hypothetical protein